MRPLQLTISALLSIWMISCYGQAGIDSIKFSKEIPIPSWGNGEPDLFYKVTQQKVKQLKIDNLQCGYDSLQIRIWYDYSIDPLRKLLIIKRTNGAWSAVAYTMTAGRKAGDLVETIKAEKIESISPKNGWSSFLDQLFSLKITTLPHMDNIPGLQDDWRDGVIYDVEVATKKEYRFYSYHVPGQFQDRYWQAKNMVDIIALTETEFWTR